MRDWALRWPISFTDSEGTGRGRHSAAHPDAADHEQLYLISIVPEPGSVVRDGDTVRIDWRYCQVDPSWEAGMALVRDDGLTLLSTTRRSGGPSCHGPTAGIVVSPSNILGFAQGHVINGRFVMGEPPLANGYDGQLVPERVGFSVDVFFAYHFE